MPLSVMNKLCIEPYSLSSVISLGSVVYIQRTTDDNRNDYARYAFRKDFSFTEVLIRPRSACLC
jgi:hypothetical protein